MIAFLDLQFVTRRRQEAEWRRAAWIFWASAAGAVAFAAALFATVIYEAPRLVSLVVFVMALASYMLNCSALGQLNRLARQRRERGTR